jgi:hypothetical protein
MAERKSAMLDLLYDNSVDTLRADFDRKNAMAGLIIADHLLTREIADQF